ncbi:alkylglycerol monooxygenase-like [Eriocheir sinensis]|uniref:alkylglycerol monooxygenase-like n=1 Tax=Eriocheir sinensis TaxID=95602 RepID=UPI0021C71A6A|nr:alkylglycerol monooxygenase-like [Eriocheir sinensis]
MARPEGAASTGCCRGPIWRPFTALMESLATPRRSSFMPEPSGGAAASRRLFAPLIPSLALSTSTDSNENKTNTTRSANKYCLDKNYGGFLIVWDRLFGTFEAERDEEPVVYGLVDQPQSSNILYLQFFYIRDILKKAREQETWGNFFRALLYGPGWSPGTQRLGDLETFPDVRFPRQKYDPQVPFWLKSYISVHFLVTLFLQQLLTFNLKMYPAVTAAAAFVFILTSICNISALFDAWPWCGAVEVARCGAFLAYARATPVSGVPLVDDFLISLFFASAVLWTFRTTLAGAALKPLKLLRAL